MIRQIIIPTQNTFTINLPNEMIGKEVEVIAFEIEKNPIVEISSFERIKQIDKIFEGVRVSLNGFKFNRDEANDYDREK